MRSRAITEQALHLSERERAELAHKLLESLDDLPQETADQLWAETATRRASEIDGGEVQMVSARELENRANEILK